MSREASPLGSSGGYVGDSPPTDEKNRGTWGAFGNVPKVPLHFPVSNLWFGIERVELFIEIEGEYIEKSHWMDDVRWWYDGCVFCLALHRRDRCGSEN